MEGVYDLVMEKVLDFDGGCWLGLLVVEGLVSYLLVFLLSYRER